MSKKPNVKANYSSRTPKRRRKRRRLKKGVKILFLALVVLIAALIAVPRIRTNSKLRSLGYTKNQVAQIKKLDLTKTILDNGYYSEHLAKEIEDGTIRTEYIPLYTAITGEKTLTEKDYLLYNRLLDAGYEQDQIENLFSQLEFYEITPLLVFDYQWDEKAYIDDCIKNRATNSPDSFTLTGSYRTAYKVKKETDNPTSVSALVNQTYYLTDSFVPSELTEIPSQYAISDQRLSKPALDALVDMCEAGITNGTQFFVTTSYRSYDTQETAYKTFLNTMNEAQADAICNRAGFSEHQTGLAINVAATYETDKDFIDTDVYSWLKATCANYGWIARYPEEKKILTGMGDEPDHFRYLGRDLALAVTESKLTYDEYYCLYLKSWEDEANKPAEDILNATDYHNRSASPVTTSSPQETPEVTETPETAPAEEPVQTQEETPTEKPEETPAENG